MTTAKYFLDKNDMEVSDEVYDKYMSIFEQLSFDNDGDGLSFAFRLEDPETAWHIILTNNENPDLFSIPTSDYSLPYVYKITEVMAGEDEDGHPATIQFAISFLVYLAMISEEEFSKDETFFGQLLQQQYEKVAMFRGALEKDSGAFESNFEIIRILVSMLLMMANTDLMEKTQTYFSILKAEELMDLIAANIDHSKVH